MRPQMIYGLEVTTAPEHLVVSLNEIRARLGLQDNDDTEDPEIVAMIRAATAGIEQYLRRTLIDTTFTMFLDQFPGQPLPWWDGVRQIADTQLTDLTVPITLPLPPLDSVVHVKWYDDADTATTISSSTYIVDTARDPGRIVLKTGQSWPLSQLRAINGVEVQYIAGYGPVGSDVPEPIRDAIMIYVADMHGNKGGEALKFEKVGDSSLSRFSPEETGSLIPRRARDFLSSYRIWKI